MDKTIKIMTSKSQPTEDTLKMPSTRDGCIINRSLLIVDDDHLVLNSLIRQLKPEGYIIYSATRAKTGLELFQKHEIGVVISDQLMPEMDGVTFLEIIRKQKPDVVRILVTAYTSLESSIAAINRSQIFSYISKPWSNDALKGTVARAFEHFNLIQRNNTLLRLTHEQNQELKKFNALLEKKVQERTAKLEETVREGVIMLAIASEAKDYVTGNHVKRISELTRKICLAIGMSHEEAEKIGLFSMMHDIGKIHIPDNILNKKGTLTKDEWDIMKSHSISGEKILGGKPYYQIARDIARSHHERWDGTGYPSGLKGEEIPLVARIVSIADVFDAMTHERPYKKAVSIPDTLATMKDLSGKAFEPNLLEVFFRIIYSEI